MILCTYLGSMIPCDVRWRHRIQIDCTRQTYGAPYFDVDRSLSMNLGMSSCKVRKNIFGWDRINWSAIPGSWHCILSAMKIIVTLKIAFFIKTWKWFSMRFLGRNIIDSLSKKSFNFLKFRETLKKYGLVFFAIKIPFSYSSIMILCSK